MISHEDKILGRSFDTSKPNKELLKKRRGYKKVGNILIDKIGKDQFEVSIDNVSAILDEQGYPIKNNPIVEKILKYSPVCGRAQIVTMLGRVISSYNRGKSDGYMEICKGNDGSLAIIYDDKEGIGRGAETGKPRKTHTEL